MTIHSLKERLPVPLSIHHIPISITFAVFEEGEIIVYVHSLSLFYCPLLGSNEGDGTLCSCDPTYKEEQAMESRMTMTLNAQEEICAVQKAGGSPLEVEQILECTRIAVVKVQALDRWIKDQLALDAERRKSQQPTAVGFTPHIPKQAQWEAIYQKDQAEAASPSSPVEEEKETKKVTPVVAAIKKEVVEEDSDEDVTMTNEPIRTEQSLFSGGHSAWDGTLSMLLLLHCIL